MASKARRLERMVVSPCRPALLPPHRWYPACLAAVRELGRLSGPGIANELLNVYTTGDSPVKFQVVTALGERAATTALMQIGPIQMIFAFIAAHAAARLATVVAARVMQRGHRFKRKFRVDAERPLVGQEHHAIRPLA